MNNNKALWCIIVFGTTFLFLCVAFPKQQQVNHPTAYYNLPTQIVAEPPRIPTITNPRPVCMDYNKVVSQLKEWNAEAPDFTDIGVYGQSAQGTDLYYLRITNKKSLRENIKDVILITGSIHGDESISTATIMWYMGDMLSQCSKRIELLDTKDIYFIPVVSPDAYPYKRMVNGVDPNRNFPTQNEPNKQSIAIIQSLKNFTLKIKPRVAISGHSFGRVFIYPWGDQRNECPNKEDYFRILDIMTAKSGYGTMKLSKNYGSPIYGTEEDWYYRQGIFSLVVEYGTHQRQPTYEEVNYEFKKTYDAILYCINAGSKVQIMSNSLIHSPLL